jgi:hypothetical protein
MVETPVGTSIARGAAAVFARNEARNLDHCLRHLVESDFRTRVTTILNGCDDDSPRIAENAYRTYGIEGRIYEIGFADKSNAINQYFYGLRPPADIHFLVDGYARVAPDSLGRLAARLETDRHANAAAALPSMGRSASALRATMMAEGGLHGSLFALRGSFIDRIVAHGFRLPIGVYRGDGLIGSMVMFDLDPLANDWDRTRTAPEPSATWSMPVLRLASPRDVARQFQRMVRQAQGRMEGAAIRDTIRRGGFGALPGDARSLLDAWLSQDPSRRPSPYAAPLAALALRRVNQRSLPSPEAMTPRLRWSSDP